MPSTASMAAGDVAITNINMIISVRHIPKKDVAAILGKFPQSFSRMLKIGYPWTFDDMVKVANYLGVTLNDLTDVNLTAAKVLQMQKPPFPDDSGNGGQLVAGHGFEPWTSGCTCDVRPRNDTADRVGNRRGGQTRKPQAAATTGTPSDSTR